MYITICKTYDQCKFDAWSRALKASALGQPRGMSGEGDGRGVQDGGYMCTSGWLMSMYGKKPSQNCKVTVLQLKYTNSVHFSSVTQSCPTLCDPMNCSMPGFPVHHQLPESTQTHVHWVGDAIQSSRPLSSPSPPALNPSQHQGLFQWVSSSHQVAKVLEFQLQHQSFQWTLRTDLH